ncbi:bifunctional riboflavin kinase/FAD synthetase [Pontimonas sp.]|jgi:riboflavin kinase/FMN adenylyltransferase|nr:bifunctional riboflavin kinase/FAD synthetase [Pontimonas sp.]MDA8862723.1 bifunctional riboflavin kinase/FAD synthetase [Pontimonas sp.]MDA8887346.1 bifunctional riboflavin kinase/FAD synthetase [Pontimonas sp.]
MSPVAVNYGLDSLPGDGKRRAVTIGKFDGVHRGHRQVITQLLSMAGKAEPTVITFDRHPHATLKPGSEPTPILSDSQKIELLAAAGIERVVVLPFDEELSALDHEDFARTVLAEGLSTSVVLVGADFRYGHGGEGTIDTLRAEGDHWGFRVDVVADVCEAEGERVSSTMIRGLLAEGKVSTVRDLLNRYHSVRGEVGHGFERGRVLGYPTANLRENIEGLLPADGVYATRVIHRGKTYDAATSLGVNPTFGDVNERTLESHLMDVTLDLYGETVTIEFVDFIRGMQKFPTPDALALQMARDEEVIRGILGSIA